jgi:hypothetical protein
VLPCGGLVQGQDKDSEMYGSERTK